MSTELHGAAVPRPRCPEPQAQLRAGIEAANDLLRRLGAPAPQELGLLRLPLQRLVGRPVQVAVAWPHGSLTLAGPVRTAGRDFLELAVDGGSVLVPYRSLCAVSTTHQGTPTPGPGHQQAAVDLPPEFRRRLILRFGEVVSADRRLMDLFFGVPLRVRLKDLLGQAAAVATTRQETEPVVRGVLEAVEPELRLCADGQEKRVRFEEICFVRV